MTAINLTVSSGCPLVTSQTACTVSIRGQADCPFQVVQGSLGETDSGVGVLGLASGGDGVVGSSSIADGVAGFTSTDDRAGVYGEDDSPDGAHGVFGRGSPSGIGVYGTLSTGTSGITGQIAGVVDSTIDGVIGLSSAYNGVYGISVAQSGVAPGPPG